MAQIFRRRANSLARAAIAGVVIFICANGWLLHAVYWSPWTTREMMPLEQPVPFSHKHHVYGLNLDCRFCHATVEQAAFAGMPDTETCMTCHSQIWKDAPLLAPVRESLAKQTPLRWNRVNQTPDFVFLTTVFTCITGLAARPATASLIKCRSRGNRTLYMKWCLECRRAPEKFIRPRDEVFNLNWTASNQLALGKNLVGEYAVHTAQLTDCSMCHR
jgi:hypothetical protein